VTLSEPAGIDGSALPADDRTLVLDGATVELTYFRRPAGAVYAKLGRGCPGSTNGSRMRSRPSRLSGRTRVLGPPTGSTERSTGAKQERMVLCRAAMRQPFCAAAPRWSPHLITSYSTMSRCRWTNLSTSFDTGEPRSSWSGKVNGLRFQRPIGGIRAEFTLIDSALPAAGRFKLMPMRRPDLICQPVQPADEVVRAPAS
jgi:hypothetical protein